MCFRTINYSDRGQHEGYRHLKFHKHLNQDCAACFKATLVETVLQRATQI